MVWRASEALGSITNERTAEALPRVGDWLDHWNGASRTPGMFPAPRADVPPEMVEKGFAYVDRPSSGNVGPVLDFELTTTR